MYKLSLFEINVFTFLILGYVSSDTTTEMQNNIANAYKSTQLPKINPTNENHDTNISNKIYSDVKSVRTLASIAIGSTDGRNIIIKRVPNTPNELFSMVNTSPTS